jgi:DNA repair exonuclease SbcCD ATPase subunit
MPDADQEHLNAPQASAGVAPAAPSSDPPVAGSPFALLEAERQRLEQFTRDQLAQISRARDAFLQEKRATEQALETRRQQLEEQGQLLRNRLQELHEREKKAGDRSDDALPERNANYRRRRFSSLIDKRKLEEESQDPELKALREQLQEMKQTMVLLRGERDAAWDELQQVRQELNQAQENKALAGSSTAPSADPTQVAELEALRRQVQQQQQLLQDLQAKPRRNFPSDELQRRLDQLKSERDAALSEVERLVQEPEGWTKQEEEFAALSRELRGRESKLQEDLRMLAQEHQRLEKTAADFQERSQQLDQQRQEHDNRDREFRFREEQLRLREAEIKEMRDLIEQDNALARKELVQERSEVARLRELLQHERGASRPSV